MPADKAHRVSIRRARRNKPVRTLARNRVARARIAIQNDPAAAETSEAIRQAMSALDKAASKGVIHPNNAARRISRMTRRLNEALAGEREASAS